MPDTNFDDILDQLNALRADMEGISNITPLRPGEEKKHELSLDKLRKGYQAHRREEYLMEELHKIKQQDSHYKK